MARTFRRERRTPPISDLNVTNLIDVAFTLLIVFMIAAPLIQEQTIPVNLPVESISPQVKPDPQERTESITVMADGRLFLGGSQMTLQQLAVELARFAQEPRPPNFHLRIDAEAKGQEFVAVMDELKKNSLTRISIDTRTAR